ncbi:hypothetical protein [Dyella caseinilytica]|uniref:Uncharacterized protein n=1 Tax=Dyella caseinilytica TaxID=1849581 RepID=A0ABX7GPM3_9GAMM|nr:hypothetical protein [Dyella caseinilytica]QRN52361.1 hypothetical protein ISN74_12805 [Dyella caseinilytica]
MSADVPQPLPYTLQELARSLPAPMPTTKEVVQAFLRTSLHLRQADEYMREYNIATPLITRDGYIIKRVYARENPPGANGWRTDDKNFFALDLTFASTPCVPVESLRQILNLPQRPIDITGPEPGNYIVFGRYQAWGGVFISVRNAQPNCAASLSINVFPPPPREP